MADGRWVMTENELNNVVSGFKETDIEALPNAGKSMAVDVRGGVGDACSREMKYNEICAFCGSDKMRMGFGKYGQGFGCRSSKCEVCGGVTDFVYKDEVGKFFR